MIPSSTKPIPEGYTNTWDSTIGKTGDVFRWSHSSECWIKQGCSVTIEPNQSLADAFEKATDHPLFDGYNVFFPCDT